ncbi:HK97 family phage prohead protease [Pseudoclavibacter alba]|uniref:HK97 family phage prohead protease n=1 Tax=Pseudoclavibacter albus TaxID=272241 RepID=A0ABT2HYK2_9MICO|nr:HK97 family phage prohead protease [Pseudoclavibacter alba]MCT2043401.1 HK97 family phage prohead protease [Pseudoclavibacter alba]
MTTAHLTASLGAVNETERLITATILPIGARASSGRWGIDSGDAITPREPYRKVKMLIDHDETQPVGYMTEYRAGAVTIEATFKIADGPAGDKALADAAAGTRDGVSVGILARAFKPNADGTRTVTDAELYEVSLVAIPDFSDAAVTAVAATLDPDHDPEGNTMPTETDETTTPTEPQTESTATPETVTAKVEQPTHTPAPMRAELTPRPTTLQAAVSRVAGAINTGDTLQLRAALADIIPSDDKGHGFIGRSDWIGELFTAANTARPWVDAFGPTKQLTTMKIEGWRWKQRPKPAKYAGDKAEVPTNKATTEAVTFTAERWAGGWDIDRIFLDLADPGFLESFWTAAMAEYLVASNADIAAKVIAEGKKNKGTSASPLAAVKDAAAEFRKVGGQLSGVFLSGDLYDQWAELKQSEVPFWLANATGSVNLRDGSATAGVLSVQTAPELPTGTVFAYDKRAASVREKSPIQVKAFDVAHAGIDLGFYSYGLLEVHDPRLLHVRTVTASAPDPQPHDEPAA